MAENENGQEKSEDATPKRLEKSREDGQVARSKELTTAAVLLSGVGALIVFGGQMAQSLMVMMRFNLKLPPTAILDESVMLSHLGKSFLMGIELLAPLLVVLLIAALVAPVALGGWLFSGKALAPKFSRMNPLSGLKRMFSPTVLVELLKGVGKFALIAGIAIFILIYYKSSLLALGTAAVKPSVANAMSITVWSILAASSAMIIIAAIDIPYQIYDHAKKMKMTLQEVKDEFKDSEGKPEVKGRIRQLQREMAQRRMMEAVPEADVVITNPEHFSVALKYDVEGGGAPIVIAKGVDFLAIKIREIAKAHEIVMMQAPPLARAIYFTTEIDDEIPGALYLAVAQVLAYVFQLKTHRDGQGEKPASVSDISVPEEMSYDVNGKKVEPKTSS